MPRQSAPEELKTIAPKLVEVTDNLRGLLRPLQAQQGTGIMEHITSTPTAKGPTERFTGDVYLNMIEAPAEPARLAAALVRFTPGARTNWHSHANGQTLYITDGIGLVGTRDGEVVRVSTGETVKCPAGEEHWHGATDTTLMAHIAMVVGDGNGDGTTWLEPVTDEQYAHAIGVVTPEVHEKGLPQSRPGKIAAWNV